MGIKGEPTQVTVCQFCSILMLGVNCYMEFIFFSTSEELLNYYISLCSLVV